MSTDRELIKHVKNGNNGAFAEIYDKYVDQIYKYIYFKVGSREDCEDITEQVFLNAFEKINQFKFNGPPFIAWLYKIAQNLVVDHYRKKNKVIEFPLEKIVLPTSSKDNPENIYWGNLTMEGLYQALSNIRDEQREVIILRFIEGLSTAEVAEVMSKSSGAIRALQYRALKSLNKILSFDKLTEKIKA